MESHNLEHTVNSNSHRRIHTISSIRINAAFDQSFDAWAIYFRNKDTVQSSVRLLKM